MTNSINNKPENQQLKTETAPVIKLFTGLAIFYLLSLSPIVFVAGWKNLNTSSKSVIETIYYPHFILATYWQPYDDYIDWCFSSGQKIR